MTCEICQLSEDRHQAPHQAYAAGIGAHAYRETPPGCAPPNPLTGVHVDETPSDRLPSYQTGRVPTQDRAPVDPADAFQRELIRKKPFLGPALDQAALDLQKQDRPGIIRRILNARKASS